MKTTSTYQRAIFIATTLVLATAISFGQGTLKNNGTFRNTGTSNYKEVQNYGATTGGIIKNSGTLNVTNAGGTKNLLNWSGAKKGNVTNYIGATGGTIVVGSNLDNGVSGAIFDNDTSGGTVSTLTIAGAITNSGTFDTDSGRVIYNAAGAQNVFVTTYGALVVDGGNTKSLQATTTVNDSLRVDNSTTLGISTFELDLKGATNTVQNSATFNPGAAASTVKYIGDRVQSIIPATYYNLELSGSTAGHIKTATGGVSFAASGSLTLGSNDTLEVSSGVLNLTNLSGGTYNISSAIRISSTSAPVLGSLASFGNLIYSSGSAQSIAAGTYSNLSLRGAGTKNFPTTTVSVTGNYAVESSAGGRNYSTGTFAFAGTSSQTISGLGSESFNILQFSGAGTKSIGSGATITAASVTVAASTGAVANSATSFTISSGGLTINSGSSWTNNASMGITGGLTNNNLFTQSSGTLTISSLGVTNNSTGTFAISSGAVMNATGDVANDGIFINDGTITVN